VTDAPPPALPELETAVMERVWARGEATVHAVRDDLNARSERQRAYTTVLTVMVRLCAKGLLHKQCRGRRDHYVAAMSRDEYVAARARSEVATLVAEYGDLALAHFAARVDELDAARREKLARLARGG